MMKEWNRWQFQYLGVDTEEGGFLEAEVSHLVGGANVLRSLRGVWRKRDLSEKANEGIFIPTVL